MDDAALDEADRLLAGAREIAAAGQPSAAWVNLLRARATYEELHRPWDVASVDVALGGQNVQLAAEGHAAAWERLLADVGWTPGPPAPLPDLTVTCLGDEHELTFTDDWRAVPVLTRAQQAEHVAAALVGEEALCAAVGRGVDAVRVWAATRQRLRHWEGSWSEPDLERWERQAGWLSAGLDGGPSEPPLPEGPVGDLLGALPAMHPPEPNGREASALVVGGGVAIEWLWRRGVHPDLVRAIHAALGVDGPLDPQTVARLVVRRVVHPADRSGALTRVREWCDDPLPVGCLVGLLGGSAGERRLSMVHFLAAAGGARDADHPSRLLRWWRAHDLPEQARVALHRAGFEPSDLTRWSKSWAGVSVAELARTLQESPPGRWPLIVWGDLAGYLAQKHLEHATRWEEIPDECEALLSPLSAAVASGVKKQILGVASAVERNYTGSDPLPADCPVWVTARVQEMVALHAEHPRAAASMLSRLRTAAGASRADPQVEAAEWVWVALERQAGRLVPFPPASEESAELVFSLLEHVPSPPDAPKAQWLAHFGSVIDRVWGRLRMAGVTLEQAVRWQPADPELRSEYVLWLADFQPYPWPVEQPGKDPIVWLIDECCRRARRSVVIERGRVGRAGMWSQEQKAVTCWSELHPALESAVASNDPNGIDAAARAVLRGHTYYRTGNGYHHHHDSCQVDQLARLVLGMRAYSANRSRSFELLIGRHRDGQQQAVRYPSAVCMVGWLAMNLGEGRFFRDEVLAAAWRGAADRSVDGRWLLRVVLEASASTLPTGVPD